MPARRETVWRHCLLLRASSTRGNIVSLLTIGLLLFFGAHSISIINEPWRDQVVARIGRERWRAIYSLLAIAGLACIVWGYGAARPEATVLYVPPAWLRSVAMVGMVFVFPMFLASILPGRISAALKHPLLVATKLWAMLHLLTNGSTADLLLFGSFLTWAVIDRISFKRRTQRQIPAVPPGRWNDLIAVVIGVVIYIVLIAGGHIWLTGMPVGSRWG